MVTSSNHKAIEIGKEDYEYMDEIRDTQFGKASFAKVIHKVLEFWKENH